MHHLLIIPVLLLLAGAAADVYPAVCSNATCGGHSITYPFWLAHSGPNCGYPGLGLLCVDDAPILDIQFHQYRVLRIDYANHTVSLADVDAWNKTCPRLSYSLAVDPNAWLQLTPSNSELAFLYNCKTDDVSRHTSAVSLDGCVPEEQNISNWYVFPDNTITTGKEYGHELAAYGCEKTVVTPVLLSSHNRLMINPGLGVGEALSDGFEMSYGARSEQCGACERSGGRCRYGRIEQHGGTEFACFCADGGCGDARPLSLKRWKLFKQYLSIWSSFLFAFI